MYTKNDNYYDIFLRQKMDPYQELVNFVPTFDESQLHSADRYIKIIQKMYDGINFKTGYNCIQEYVVFQVYVWEEIYAFSLTFSEKFSRYEMLSATYRMFYAIHYKIKFTEMVEILYNLNICVSTNLDRKDYPRIEDCNDQDVPYMYGCMIHILVGPSLDSYVGKALQFIGDYNLVLHDVMEKRQISDNDAILALCKSILLHICTQTFDSEESKYAYYKEAYYRFVKESKFGVETIMNTISNILKTQCKPMTFVTMCREVRTISNSLVNNLVYFAVMIKKKYKDIFISTYIKTPYIWSVIVYDMSSVQNCVNYCNAMRGNKCDECFDEAFEKCIKSQIESPWYYRTIKNEEQVALSYIPKPLRVCKKHFSPIQ